MKLLRPASASAAVLAALLSAAPAAAATAAPARSRAVTTATPVRHFLFLMQGGRTFDNYFGTYPGADGIPAGTCQPRTAGRPRSGCVRPFPLAGQPPPLGASKTTIAGQYDHGKMDGFVSAYVRQGRNGTTVMGYYDARQLPFYWHAAGSYVLFDHFFSSTMYGIRSNRSYWVSAAPAPGGTGAIPQNGYPAQQLTIFDRLQAAGVSWKFYVQDYHPRGTYQTASPANPETQTARVPLVDYRRFTHDPALSRHITGLAQYYQDLAHGTLPAVAFITSSSPDNERSARSIAAGQALTRNLVTQLMESRYWDSSALLVSYDGSGGWYDHVPPPKAGRARLGFRVPALLISAFARRGLVDHTVLEYSSALAFIERNWGLAPLTKRDARASSFAGAFDFSAGPRPPAVIPGAPGPRAAVTVATGPPPVARVYTFYGGAALACVAIVLFAAAWPRLTARRRPPAGDSPAGPEGVGA